MLQLCGTAIALVAALMLSCGAAFAQGGGSSENESEKDNQPSRDENVLAALGARITGGAIFFNGAARIVPDEEGTTGKIESAQFSQAAVYLAFEAQPRLWSTDLVFCGRDDTCRTNREKQAAERGYYRVYVDPFVNARLTTIPVTGSPQDGPIKPPDTSFLQSQKAVQLQLGAIAGFNFGSFDIEESKFHWGFGPVFRFMFQNVTDSQRAVRVWDIDNDLFKLGSGGLRLTLYERSGNFDDVRSGWVPAAYVDVSRGYFENFERAKGLTPAAVSCLANPAECLVREGGLPPDGEYDVLKPTRWYIEGRVFLQHLYLGFDLNSGSGPDDLRFIAGATVRLDQFFDGGAQVGR